MSENTKTATLVKANLPGFCGTASLYRLSEPLEGHEFVIASAVAIDLEMIGRGQEPETYLFPADETGAVKDWGELDGSLRGTLSHTEALGAAGYSIAAGDA